jgi:hypothetical protein
MAIFDKELIDNVSDRTPDGAKKLLPSPTVRDVDVSLGGFEMYGDPNPGKTGLKIDQLSEFSGVRTNQSSFSSPVQMVPRSELLANQRYNTYQRGVDLENVYGLQQSWTDQLANGVVKMGGLGVGTFLQGFATIPNTISAAKNGKLSDLSGGVDGYEAAIDNWTKNLEDYFPNYVTREEQKHPYLAMVPFAPGSANFWGDKIIKNLGFTAGAIGSAIVQDAAIGLVTEGIGAIPLVAGQIGKASLFLNKIFTGTNNVEKALDVAKTAGVAADKILDVKKLGSIAEYTKVTDGFRYGMSIYGSARTEAAIEARDSYRTVREDLLRQYKLENAGVDPTGEDAEQIEDYATSAMNTRFGINMALLTASNAIQFGNLFKSFTSANKAVSGQITRELEDLGKIGLKEGSKDVFEAKVATGLKEKIWESVRPKVANILTEGVYEEGGQYATEKGVYDYFTRKYKNLSDPKNKETWNETNEIVNSTLTGLKNQFGSSEGLENMMVGAISALISGGIMGKIDAAKGQGKEARLQSAINILNQYGLTGTLTNQYENTLSSSVIAKEMDEAVKANDVFKYKNLKNDMFINFVQSRIPSGMHEVTIEQLRMLKDLDKAEFEKSFGMDFNSSNKSTVNEYVDSLIDEANQIKKISDSINFTFKNPFNKIDNPITDEEEIETSRFNDFNDWKAELTFLAAKVPNVNNRLDSVQQSVNDISPIVTNDLLSQLTNKESLKDLSTSYEEKANQLNKTITEFTSIQDKKRINNQVKALRTASERINLGLKDGVDNKLFDYLLNFELNNQDPTASRQVGPENATDLFTYGHDINRLNSLKDRVIELYDNLTGEEGFNKFMDQGEQLRSGAIPEEEDKEEKEIVVKEGPQFINKAGVKETFEEGREYQIPAGKKARIDKIADDRWQVTAPDGNITFYGSEEKAKEQVDSINEEFGNLQKAKVIAINPDGTLKVEDINGDIYNVDPSKFEGYEKVETEQEKLQKFKQDVEEDQKDIEHTSGTIASKENTAKTKAEFDVESKKKGIEWLFISTSGASEDWESGKLSPSQQRAITLRNNYRNLPNRNNLRIILVTQNQENSLGLSGLTAMSMANTGVDPSTYTDLNDGFVGAVYVEQDGADVYFVDKSGKKLGKVGDPVDINQVVFDTMPTTSLTWSDKENRYRAGDEDKAQEYSDKWKAKRNQLLNTPEGKYEIYKFSVSPGIPDIANLSDNNTVGETLIPENEIVYQEGLVVIPTTGNIQHQGRNLKFPDGVPVFQYRDVLTFLKTRKFTKAEARTIFEVMKKMSEDIKQKLDQGKKIKSNKKYTRFLQNVLYWRKSPKTDKNQVYIDFDTMDFFFGGKRYDLTNLGASEAEIIDQLENLYANINNDSLTKNFSEKFNEYYIDESKNLATRTWDNYQSYLLSSKYPDGSNRSVVDIPLTTPIQKPTELKPFNFKQKYSILEGVELPSIEVKPVVKPEAPTAPAPSGEKIGDYTVDGVTQNVYQLKNGPVGFTATIKDGEVFVEVESNDTIKKITDNKDALNNTIIPLLKAEKKFDATEKDEQHVLGFVSLKIANDLQKQLNASVAPTTAAVLQPDVSPIAQVQGTSRTEPVTTAVSTDAKTDIKETGNQLQVIQMMTLRIDSLSKEERALMDKYYDVLKAEGLRNGKELSELYHKVKKDGSNPELVKQVDEFLSEVKKLQAAPVATDVKPTTQFTQSFGAFTVYEGSDGSYDVQDNTGEGIIAEYVKTKEEAILIAKRADIEKRRKEELKSVEPYKAVFDAVKKANVDTDSVESLNKIKQDAIDLKIIDASAGNSFVKSNGSKFTSEENIFVTEPINKINAKYDAELNALEEAKPTAPTNFGGTKPPPNTEYRRVGADGIERISSEELELFKAWAAEKVPTIPYTVMENVLTTHDGEKAWGAFENGVAKFYRSAARGTEYHEIGEAVWNGMLSPEERQAILDEERQKSGKFKDRQSGKTYSYDDPNVTDQMLKERIMDDFAEFRLGKLPARSLKEKVLRFFRSIIEFFKQFVQKPSMKEQLFKAIDTGRFKERVISESAKNEFAEYRAVEGLTEEQTHDFVQDITARVFQIAFGTNMSLYNPEQITAPQIFAEIKESYQQEGKLDLLSENTWRQLIGKTRDFLRTFKIDFDEEGVLGINDENYNKNDYAREAFSTDWKKSSPFPIKLILGTLTETVPTSQIDTTSLDLPKQKLSSVNGYKILNFARTFATALDKFANTNSVTKLVDKLIELSRYDSNYVRLFTRLKGDRNTVSIDFSKFEEQDWRLFINFYQTFTKQKPNAVIQYIGENNEVYNGAANLFSAVEQFKQGWIENVKTLANDNTSLIYYYSPDKTYRTKKLSDIPIGNPQQMVEFLDKLGINFPFEVYQNLKDPQQKAFGRAISAIHKYASEKEIGKVTGETLTINGQLNTLAELYIKATNPNIDSTYFGVDGKRQQSYADSNAPSVFENTFNEVGTLDELLSARPELNDVFSKNSLILKKGGPFFDKDGKRTDRKLKVGYIQGTKDTVDDKGTSTSKLGLGSRFTQEFNQNLSGDYYILIPADGSTEWMLNLGNQISFEDFEGNEANDQIHKTFRGYLEDEIELALSDRSYLRNVKPRAKELRFFKDILSETLLTNLNKLIEKGDKEKIKEFIDENIAEINANIDDYVNGTVDDSIRDFKNNSQIFQINEDVYSFPLMNDKFAKEQDVNKYNMSEDELKALFKFANTNYIINNIEFHKILFGDPYQFAIKENQLDETKRIKSFLSPRRVTFDSPEFNTWLNSKNKAGDISLLPGDPGYHVHKSYTSTITTADVNIVGSIAMMEGVPKDIKDAYAKTNEADAASILMDTTYREIKNKNGQWSREAEDWHQWQMAYTRNRMSAKGLYTYTNDNLKKQDEKTISSPSPKHTLEILKPIVTGSKHNKNTIDLVLDKFSQMPMYYSMIEGTNLENLYLKMMKEDVGYTIMISGRKVGAESLHSLYNQDGSFNQEAFNNRIEVPWKAYGIQVETTTEDDKYQTRGSQLTKMSSMDLFSNGDPLGKNPERKAIIKKAYDRNKDILDKMHENSYYELLNKLGVEDLGDSFNVVDRKKLSESLEHEMLRRELSDNAIDTVRTDENGQFRIPFESSPAYTQIRSLMFSMVDKALVSPKMSGGAHVQVPVTLWESATKGRSLAHKTKDGWKKITKQEYDKLDENEKKKVALTDDTLKFYTKDAPYCEVMIPHWFKDKFPKNKFKTDEDILNYLNNTEEGRKILTGIGFRIPTQATSSVEVFRVKGFLPKYMGATVIVPSEITTKSGSDFDIDKLNMYLKSVYVNARGEVKLIKYLGSEGKTKEFFRGEFDRILEGKAVKKTELLEAVDIRAYNLADPKNLLKRYDGILNVLLEDYNDISDLADSLMKDLEKLGDESVQADLKEKFVNQAYKQSLENEYYESLEELLTLPEVFQRLISPVSDGGLKKLSETLDGLTGFDESKIKNRLLNRSYMTALRHAFVSAKKWVGIAAVNITGHSLFQKSQIYLDPERFAFLPKRDKELLGDGSVVLPHNTVVVNGKTYVSMSGAKTEDGTQYISDRLSGYGTSFVDVAKDPYIMKIIKSELVVGTFMYLERIGVGEKAAMFLNQPIIAKYLSHLDSIGYKNLFNKGNITNALESFPSKGETFRAAGVDVNSLESNIEKYYKNGGKFDTDIDNAVQQKIFFEFLKYAKMAEFSFNLTQGYNYDTTRFGSGDALFRKQVKTQKARDRNIFSSIDKVFDTSFIGDQAFLIDKSTEALGEYLKLENPKLRIISDSVLRPFAENQYLSADDHERIGNRITSSFLDFIIQTKTTLSDEIKELLVDPATAVATQLAEAQAKFPENKLLNELQVVSSDRFDGAKSIKLRTNDKSAYSENLYQGMFRQLRDTPETNALYNNIVKLAILQGTYQSAISIRNVIPIEDFSKTIAPVIANLVATPEIEAFAKGAFQRNNWKNQDVWRTISPKFFVNDEPIGQVETYSGDVIDIYQYNSPAFPNVANLNIKSEDRKILTLNEAYNYLDVQRDFLLVPAVVTDRKTGDMIDVETGTTMAKSMIAQMKAKGDMSYKDVYGYQKVRYDNGDPVLTYDKDGNAIHIYKLINLYGDGVFASEYYNVNKPSVFNNGTKKIDNEIPNADIINYFAPRTTDPKPIAPTPIEPKPAEEPKKKELFTPEKGIAQKSFRGKPLNFVDKIPTQKETVVAMQNNRQTGVITIDYKAMVQKFDDKAWTKPAKQLDGSFATPLAEDAFKSAEEWFTFALIHEVKHDTIFKEPGETTGQYEDRINQAAMKDLEENYTKPPVVDNFPDKNLNVKDQKCN